MTEFNRDTHPEYNVPDRSNQGMSGLGWLFAAAGFGYALHRNVPAYTRAKAALAIEKVIEENVGKLPFLKRLLPDVIDEIPQDVGRALDPRMRAAASVERRLRGNYYHADMRALHKMLVTGSDGINLNNFPVRAGEVIDPVLERYFVGNVRSFVPNESIRGARQMTFEDFQQMAAAGKDALDHISRQSRIGSALAPNASKMSELMAHPVFSNRARNFLRKKGVDTTDIWEQFTVDPHLWITAPNKKADSAAWKQQIFGNTLHIQSTRRFTLSNIAEGVSKARIPGLNWAPFRVLYPTELLRSSPTVALLTPGQHGRTDIKGSAIFSGGKLFPIEEHKDPVGKTIKRITEPVAENMRLGSIRSGMGRAFLQRTGQIKQSGGRYVRALDKAGMQAAVPDWMEKVWDSLAKVTPIKEGGAPEFFAKLRFNALRFGDKVGIGPQFKTDPAERGIVGNFITRLYRTAASEPTITTEVGNGDLLPAVATSEFNETLRKKTNAAANFVRRMLGFNEKAMGKELPKSLDDLSWWEKVQLNIGLEPKRAVLELTSFDKGPKHLRARSAPVARHALNPEQMHVPPVPDAWQNKTGMYAFSTGQGLDDFLNYQMHRVNWLAEQLFGFSLKQGNSAAATAGRWVGLGAGLYLGAEAFNYVDYKVDQFTGTSPTELVASAFVYGHYGQLALAEAAGIQKLAEETKDLLPGAIDSPLSKTVVGLGLALGGAALGKKHGKGVLGLGIGAAAGLLNAVTDWSKPAEVFRQEIEGERKVAVKRARWWGMGRQPFEGENVEMYKSHWYHQMKSHASERQIYGSRAESWRDSWMPTPENLFLLKNLFDPYYVERRHYYSRPYPESAPLFHEIPLIGPGLSATLGRFIKPPQEMHLGEGRALNEPGPQISSRADNALGYAHYGRMMPDLQQAESRQQLDKLTADALYAFKEFSGLPGFMYESVLGGLGAQQQRGAPMKADAGAIASAARSYYDHSFGGMLGYSELLRRFIPPANKWQMLNNVPNTMTPDWLPGKGSAFERDRKATTDFHTGDPYTRLKLGEERLPGAGYEALNELHSGVPGEYSPLDRMMILADVAPTSAAFRTYEGIVSGWVKAGVLEDKWQQQYYRALDMAEKRTQHFQDEDQRRFTRQNFHKENVRIDKILSPTEFVGDGRIYKLAGIESEAQALKARVGLSDTQTRNVNAKLQVLQSDMQSLVGQEVSASIGMRDGRAFPVVLEGINDRFMAQGLDDRKMDALTAFARHGKNAMAEAWENIRHSEWPLVSAWPGNKLFTRYDVVEQYRRKEIEGADFAGWDRPYDNFIKPWGRQIAYGISGQLNIPEEVQQRRRVDQYFDRLEYYKFRRLEAQASAANTAEFGEQLQQGWRQTMIGMRAPGANWMRDAYGAMPARERKYFSRFSKIQDAEDRKKILQMVPDDMKPIYMGVWSSMDPSQNMIGSPQTFDEMGMMSSTMDSQLEVDQSVADFLSRNAIPDQNWSGWSPSSNIEDYKIATIDTSAQDIHDYGIWANQTHRIQMNRPYVYSEPVMEAFEVPEAFRKDRRYQQILRQFGYARQNSLPYNRMFFNRQRNYEYDIRYQQQYAGRIY